MILNSVKVALVEDDLNLQNMYKFKLEHEGFTVATASDGQLGLSLTKEFSPDIILLDLLMPVMNGSDMLARLRESEWGSNIRVIILTNISKNEAPQSLRFLNVDRYIVKAHTTPAQIVDIIREVLK
jgi:DNA-binding response OmpR family regulator